MRYRRYESIKEVPTRELLILLDNIRRAGSYIYNEFYSDWCYHPYSYEELKCELATREHIMNKKEAKQHRRAKAKIGRQKGRKDK